MSESISKRIAGAVQEFLSYKLGDPVNKEFTAQELRLSVMAKVAPTKIAPGSPDRVLRDLRQRKLVNYILISRVKSLYKAVPVFTEAEKNVNE